MAMFGRTRLRDLVSRYPQHSPASRMTLGELLRQIGMQQHPNAYVSGNPQGLLSAGNLDLNRRPQVRNPDGSISTVRSISVGYPDGEYVIPTVIGQRVVSDDEAVRHFLRTGEHLGRFRSPREAEVYAEDLHNAQARQYQPRR